MSDFLKIALILAVIFAVGIILHDQANRIVVELIPPITITAP